MASVKVHGMRLAEDATIQVVVPPAPAPALDFFSDEPLVACPLRKPGDTDEQCEVCQ